MAANIERSFMRSPLKGDFFAFLVVFFSEKPLHINENH